MLVQSVEGAMEGEVAVGEPLVLVRGTMMGGTKRKRGSGLAL